MNSCLYECQVMHARFTPRAHRFVYRIFLFCLDLDELEKAPRPSRLFSFGRPNLYSLRDSDLLPTAPEGSVQSVRQRLEQFADSRGVNLRGARVTVITLPRIFGYRFSPVSFYFCYDAQGSPLAAIAEVTNTFREVKPFFLGPESLSARDGGFRLRIPKHFYVSPFSDVDVAFDFTLRLPAERLAIQIDDYTGEARTLTSTLVGRRHALTSARLAWFTLKYPLLTLQVITLIHWHALLLWWKRVPWYRKAARPADQRDLYHPHSSLQPPLAHDLLPRHH